MQDNIEVCVVGPPGISLNNPGVLCGYTVGWVEKLKMSKIYYGHEVPVVIHKNKGISLFTF